MVSDGIAGFSAFPHLTPDRYGRLHMVWSSGVAEGRNEEQVQADTVFYAVWTNDAWSQAVDILTDSDYAVADGIVVTADDRILISWRNRGSLFVSQAALDQAGSARAWQTQDMALGNVADSSLFVDDQGVVHLLYSAHTPAQGQGALGYQVSLDNGASWSEPSEFLSFDGSSEVLTNVQIYADSSGRLHAVWNRNTADADWLPTGVYYASSDDSGQTWSLPEEVFVGPRAAYPNLSPGALEDRLYMSWLRGVGYEDSKYLRFSDDEGSRWAEAQLVFQNLQGLNGAMPIVYDSIGNEYWIMSGDKSDGSTQIHYSRQTNDSGWTTPISISPDLRDSEFPDAVILGGNKLHVVWNEFITDDIYHVVCELDAPDIAPDATPTPGAALPVADAGPTSTPVAVASDTKPDGTDTPASPVAQTPGDLSPSSTQVLLIAIIPSAFLVVGVVLWQTGRRRRRG